MKSNENYIKKGVLIFHQHFSSLTEFLFLLNLLVEIFQKTL